MKKYVKKVLSSILVMSLILTLFGYVKVDNVYAATGTKNLSNVTSMSDYDLVISCVGYYDGKQWTKATSPSAKAVNKSSAVIISSSVTDTDLDIECESDMIKISGSVTVTVYLNLGVGNIVIQEVTHSGTYYFAASNYL